VNVIGTKWVFKNKQGEDGDVVRNKARLVDQGFSQVKGLDFGETFAHVWASKPMATVCEWFGFKTTWTVFISLALKPMVTVSGGLASKPAATVSSGLASKPAMTVFSGLASKPAVTVFSGLASKSVTTVFSSLASKLVAAISPGLALKPAVGFLVELQNQGGGGFPGLGLKISNYGLVIWA
jgi:hypothetical protein